MRAFLFLNLFFFFTVLNGQVTEESPGRALKLCELCTCSEIGDFDDSDLVFLIQCSELERIDSFADLDRIQWPENPLGLKIIAAFEGLGISTLGKLPPNSQVESLRFSNNFIKTYWPDPFSQLPNLKRISFAQNDLTEITADLFTNIQNLEDLDFSYNKLAEFNTMDFKTLHNVKRLNLQSNLLKKIPVDALAPMTALEDLDLSKNVIYDILLSRSNDVMLKGLKRLNLSGNRIRSIMKDSFIANNTLESLDLSNNIIEIVEEEAFLVCTGLKELNLAQNNITLTFALPPLLQTVTLKVNAMYHWPKFPSSIYYIDLSHNRLSEMYDESTVNFESLESLNIAGNQIKDVNIENKLPSLSTLDLSYNQLPEVPKTLNSQILPMLRELHLDGNPIESIYFKNILALTSLYMNDLSKLEVVQDKAFTNVVGRGVNETEEDLGCFYLYLSHCPSLNEIKVDAFAATSVCKLDISRNNLTYIPKSLLNWEVVTEVDFQFNPWDCSCRLQWVVDDLLPRMYKNNDTARLLAEFRCNSPSAYEGIRLVHFYNWTEQAMCTDHPMVSGPHETYMLEPSTGAGFDSKVTSLTLILGGCIVLSLLVVTALSVYLIKTRRRYRVRQAAMKRKRQSSTDAKNSNGTHKEQFSALHRA